MLLTYNELLEIREQGAIVQPDGQIPIEHVNGASIDICLGSIFFVEQCRSANPVDLSAKETPAMREQIAAPDNPFCLGPQGWCLAQSLELFFLPSNLAASFKLKSSVARAGLDAALAMWCDPGWHNSVLTLELRNNNRHHPLLLRPGMKIGQMVFERGMTVPLKASYASRGQYNNDLTAQPSKGIR